MMQNYVYVYFSTIFCMDFNQNDVWNNVNFDPPVSVVYKTLKEQIFLEHKNIMENNGYAELYYNIITYKGNQPLQ